MGLDLLGLAGVAMDTLLYRCVSGDAIVASQIFQRVQLLLLLLFATGFAVSDEQSQGFPFPIADDEVTICHNAVHYSPLVTSTTTFMTSGSTVNDVKNLQPLSQPAVKTTPMTAGSDRDPIPDQKPTSPPVKITSSSSIYSPHHTLQVTISSSKPFRGFIIQARKFGQINAVGQFSIASSKTLPDTSEPVVKSPPAGQRLVPCNGPDDTLIHWRDSSTGSLNESFSWTAPSDDVGPVQFVATVFENASSYWKDVSSPVLRKGFIPIDFSGCGKTKGCFRYAHAGHTTCDAKTCIYALTYHVVNEIALFEMTAAAEWVAVGFSSDDRMGGDDVFLCSQARTGSDAVRNYFTNIAYRPPSVTDENPLFDGEVEVTAEDDVHGVESRISCRFKRPLKVTFERSNSDTSVDLSNTWFQLYAWGSVTSSGDTINKHVLDKPPTSSLKQTLRVSRNEIISGAVAATRSMSGDRQRLTIVSLMTTITLVCRSSSSRNLR